MLPFTTLLLRVSLAPLEFARAYCEAFASAAPNAAPRLSAPKLNLCNGAEVTAARGIGSGNRVPSDRSSNSAMAMSTQFYDTQVATVNFQILFTKRDNEALLRCGRVIVTSAMAESGFASWQVARFIRDLNSPGIPKPEQWDNEQAIDLAEAAYPWTNYPQRPAAGRITWIVGLKPENLKYLQVDHQVISTFNRKPPQDQIGALRAIADAIKNKP
jgi:hypothetical protein